MKMFRNLYTKAQEMSEEKVLDTNSIIKIFFLYYEGRSQQHRKQFTSEILLIYHQKYTQYRIPSFK